MPKVLCKLPNASTKINGFNFVKHRDGMVSEELDAKVAEEFAMIKGYEIHDPSGVDPAAQAILEAARKRAEAAETAAPPAPPTRLGPTEPHPDMVICPNCTSQFKAVPVNIQARLRELEANAATKPATKPAETPPASPPAKTSVPTVDHSTSSSTPPAETPPAASEPQF